MSDKESPIDRPAGSFVMRNGKREVNEAAPAPTITPDDPRYEQLRKAALEQKPAGGAPAAAITPDSKGK